VVRALCLTRLAVAWHIVGVRVVRRKELNHTTQPATLGGILYTDKGKVRKTENEWVRLVRSIAAGDQIALHSLYEQTHRIVFTLIFRITKDRETAEELTIDVFHDVWRKASGYEPSGGPVVGWIMNQARSRAIDRVRFEQRKKRVNGYRDEPVTTSPAKDPQQACQLVEETQLLRDALHLLTPDERRVIETAFFSELTYQETAEKLNQPLGTVKTRIRAAFCKLRQAFGTNMKKAI
jgi:RNA polymerase sigma-70 factor (ECF subfamily)